jgi:hypothetical protein
MEVSPVETSDRDVRCGRNRVLSKYFVVSSTLCERLRLVTWVKMAGSVRLYIGKDVRLVDDRSRLIDSRSGSGSLSKYSLAGDGMADDNLSDDVDDAREDWVWVSSAFSNSETEGWELVEVDLEVEPVENGIDSRDGVLGRMDVLWIVLGVLSTSLEGLLELALVAEL